VDKTHRLGQLPVPRHDSSGEVDHPNKVKGTDRGPTSYEHVARIRRYTKEALPEVFEVDCLATYEKMIARRIYTETPLPHMSSSPLLGTL
jgi:hypothetical protein